MFLDLLPGGRGDKTFMFRINVPGGKTLEVAVDNEGEMQMWIEHIRSCTDMADTRVSEKRVEREASPDLVTSPHLHGKGGLPDVFLPNFLLHP